MRNTSHNQLPAFMGTRALWNVRKFDELGALNATLRRLFA